MRKTFIARSAVCFTVFFMLLFSCSKISHKTPAEINNILHAVNSGTTVVLIDVRSPIKYREGHIAGAVNIPLESKTFDLRLSAFDREDEIVFYCGTGLKTVKAAETAQDQGFEKIYVLDGGIKAWQKAGLNLAR
ncbi:MAG TPA: rhodanese-like domain-containing protein [Spirochaetota bacterium]|nr:rhodanese-like domain-containing protein [Spirochaetota bacterium]HPI88968.1 rhodanese-like domain-containing protein [Spirochaetota bacterium]HPR47455.1 rhodanese-like domain-containing protein [Spirochaetota bacterium]